jgi:hypothetical protein
VANATARAGGDGYTVPRLTVRASTSQASFEHIIRGHDSKVYLKDHALTKGFAMIRRSRAALAGISRRA